jgi:phosphomethylpyrimidine synthase
MTTQIEYARNGIVTDQMKAVAMQENLSIDYIKTMIAQGKIVIPWNNKREPKVVGVGKGLRTKVNASIGTSSDIIDYAAEVRKAKIAVAAGTDTLMELSVGGDLDRVRREVIAAVDVPVGNVPLYQAFCEAGRKYGNPNKLDEEMLFDLIEQQCADGIAFMAIHCGINLYTIERLRKQGYRYGGLVSKGGVSMVAWMIANNRENPLYEKFDRVVSILKNMTSSFRSEMVSGQGRSTIPPTGRKYRSWSSTASCRKLVAKWAARCSWKGLDMFRSTRSRGTSNCKNG